MTCFEIESIYSGSSRDFMTLLFTGQRRSCWGPEFNQHIL